MTSTVASVRRPGYETEEATAVRACDEHTFLGILVDSHEVAVRRSINSGLVGNTIIQTVNEDSLVFASSIRIDISGTCTFPKSRATEKYTLAICGSQLTSREPLVKDIQVRGKDNLLAYRQYGGRKIPVYDCPLGISTFERIRGANTWYATLSVPDYTASDILAVLAQSAARPIYISIHEHRRERERWIRELYVQTKDPALE